MINDRIKIAQQCFLHIFFQFCKCFSLCKNGYCQKFCPIGAIFFCVYLHWKAWKCIFCNGCHTFYPTYFVFISSCFSYFFPNCQIFDIIKFICNNLRGLSYENVVAYFVFIQPWTHNKGISTYSLASPRYCSRSWPFLSEPYRQTSWWHPSWHSPTPNLHRSKIMKSWMDAKNSKETILLLSIKWRTTPDLKKTAINKITQ